VLGACLVSDLDKIQQVNGSFAVFLVYTAPPLLWMGSRGALVLGAAAADMEDEEMGGAATPPVGSLIALQDWMVTQWWRYAPAFVGGAGHAGEKSPLVPRGGRREGSKQLYAPLEDDVDAAGETGMLSMQMGGSDMVAGVVGGDTPVMPGGPMVGPNATGRADGDECDRSCFGSIARLCMAGVLGHRGFGIFEQAKPLGSTTGRKGGRRSQASDVTLDSDSGDDGPSARRSASAASADGVTLAEAEEATNTVYEPPCMQVTGGGLRGVWAHWCAFAPGAMVAGSIVLWAVVVVLVVSGWFG
jgi:hypothetical protein